MGEGFRNRLGGIRGLLRLLDEYGEAIEYDLICLGLRLDWLGSEALTWRDLLVIVKKSPLSSAFSVELRGHTWTVAEYLAALQVDMLRGLSWQTGGGKGQKPKPIPRPEKKDSVGRGRGVTIEEANRRLGWD